MDCPYCTITSNRKYNMKKHIERKHPDLEIPNNLLSARITILKMVNMDVPIVQLLLIENTI